MANPPTHRRSQEAGLLRTVVEHSVDGLIVIDAGGIVRFANPAAVTLLAGRTGQLVGAHLGTPSSSAPVEIDLPDGERTRHVEMRSTEILWDGRPATLASLRDITELRRTQHDLGERLKELGCLYELARIAQQVDLSTDALLEQAVRLLPRAFRFPNALARIGWRGRRFDAGDPDRAVARLSASKRTGDDATLLVEVGYLDGHPDADEGPFLAEERALLDTVAERLAHIVGHIETDASLRRAEQLLAETGRLARVGGWEVDLDADTVRWTDTTKEILEVAGDYQPTLQQAIDFCAPDARPALVEALRRAREDGAPFAVELPFVTAKGRLLWTHAIGQSEMQGGKCVRLHGTFQDITEKHAAERELRASEQRFRTYVDNAPIGLFVLDGAGRLVDVNPAACGLLGYTQDEMLGMAFRDLLAPLSDQASEVADRFVSSQRVRQEMVLKTKDGAAVTSFIQAVALPNEQLLAYCSDVTELRRAETQVRQSQRLETVGRLAGGVAHDFNNLLTVINGYADLMLDELNESDPIRPDLVAVREAGERAANLTNQLLAFSRKQVLEPTVLDLNAVVGDLSKMLRRLIGEDIELRTVCAEGLGHVSADTAQIEQVIVNLAVNARDAMPNGGMLTIETGNVELDEDYVSRHTGAGAGPYVMLAVSDDGDGMDAGVKEHIFEPFFTTKPMGKGTGLGLATVYGIVKQSGGHIWAYSELGHGTTIKVYLPRVAGEIVVASAPTPKVRATGHETVLVVEDEAALRRIVERVLKMAGYRVLVAASGGEAQLVFERHRKEIDLLLTDAVMPQMSGRELAERLTTLRPDLKVLFMSGYTEDVILHHGLVDRSMHFLSKPFRAVTLTRKVREVLDRGPRASFDS